jgi:hypothetical protein
MQYHYILLEWRQFNLKGKVTEYELDDRNSISSSCI